MAVNENSNGTTRREFMRHSGAAVAAAAFAGMHASRAGAAEGDLKVGLVGCGGRGTGALRNALLADQGAVCYALADVFPEQMDSCLEKMQKSEVKDRMKVDKDRCFSGFDGYKKLMTAATWCCWPPRPPSAPPISGRRSRRESRFSARSPWLWTAPASATSSSPATSRRPRDQPGFGLCYRYENKKRDTIKRIHEGAVGDILTIETVYNTSGLWHKGRNKKWSEMEYQLRNWLYFCWLSGDHIVEQHIHSLDKMMWVMGDKPPLKATASGGRTVRTDEKYGNIYDHFNTVFEWENGVRAFSSCRQWENAVTAVYDNVYGTTGVAKVQEHVIQGRDGSSWKWESDQPDDMYQNELDALFKSIRSGGAINNGEYMVYSNLAAIMGRMAAYSGQTVTWDEAMNSEVRLVPEKIEMGDAPECVIPVPGKGKYY
jgi:myo-inositol 2-dehydrogenase / D-chiro-inositol 1-dehydrogenase